MARGVYRRPAAIRRRRFVPPTFAASRVTVRRRPVFLRLRRVRHLCRRLRVVPAATTFAATQAPILRRMAPARRTPAARRARRALVHGVAAQVFTGAAPVSRPRLRLLRPSRPRPRRAILPTQPAAPVVPGFAQVLRTIQRQRRKMKDRLRSKPAILRLLEIPPDLGIDRIEGTTKLRVYSPGMRRGAVVRG